MMKQFLAGINLSHRDISILNHQTCVVRNRCNVINSFSAIYPLSSSDDVCIQLNMNFDVILDSVRYIERQGWKCSVAMLALK